MTPTSQVVSNTPNFFGIRVSIPGVNVNNAGPTQLLYENNYSTETWFNDGIPQILIGLLPDNTYGIAISQAGISVVGAFSTDD